MTAADTARFCDYLEAKRSVDDESLHKKTFQRFTDHLKKSGVPIILDVGTGTGAMIRRIVKSSPVAKLSFYGVDESEPLLREAERALGELFRELGYSVSSRAGFISAARGESGVEVRLLRGDILDGRLLPSLSGIPFSAVTANAFMDVVPLAETLAAFKRLMRKGAALYATINYDGTTELLPSFADRSFERLLLAVYNRSMDDRRVGSLPTGGSRTGTTLYDEAVRQGFAIAGFGSSDWSVFPWDGRYTRDEEVFLRALVETIYDEGLKHGEIAAGALGAWKESRVETVRSGRLALNVHQTDLMALRR